MRPFFIISLFMLAYLKALLREKLEVRPLHFSLLLYSRSNMN
jgi:hypothetical protein